MAHPVVEGLVTLACLTILGPVLYNYNVETMEMAVEDYRSRESEEGWTWSQVFWALVAGVVVSILYINLGKILWYPVSSFLAVCRVLGLHLGAKRCSYCQAQGAKEGVGEEGEQVWLCHTCR